MAANLSITRGLHRAAAAAAVLLLHALAVATPVDEFDAAQQAVKLDIDLAGDMVAVHIQAPLDRLVGFAHRPRTTAHFLAGQSLLQVMRSPDALLRLDESAQCILTASSVEAPVLAEMPAAAPMAASWQAADPANPGVEASFEFRCRRPERLAALDLTLFDAFERVQRIDAQVHRPTDDFSRTVQRPQRTLPLGRSSD